MPQFTVTAEVTLAEIFDEIDNEELIEEAKRRGLQVNDTDVDPGRLEAVYYAFVGKDPPEVLRQFIYETTGRIL